MKRVILIFGILLFIAFGLFLFILKIGRPPRSNNESSAFWTLRTLSTAQQMFQEKGMKDRDADGVGEYGYFIELSGLVPLPIGTEIGSNAKPAFVSILFGETSSRNEGIAERSGYYFKIYLPSSVLTPRGETGKATPPVESLYLLSERESEEIDAQEENWCAYAWPIEAGKTGNSAFFVNGRGDFFTTRNIPEGEKGYCYSGKGKMPDVYDIYENETDDLDSEIVLGRPTKHKLIWRMLESSSNYRRR